jgi:hypothetical protein
VFSRAEKSRVFEPESSSPDAVAQLDHAQGVSERGRDRAVVLAFLHGFGFVKLRRRSHSMPPTSSAG